MPLTGIEPASSGLLIGHANNLVSLGCMSSDYWSKKNNWKHFQLHGMESKIPPKNIQTVSKFCIEFKIRTVQYGNFFIFYTKIEPYGLLHIHIHTHPHKRDWWQKIWVSKATFLATTSQLNKQFFLCKSNQIQRKCGFIIFFFCSCNQNKKIKPVTKFCHSDAAYKSWYGCVFMSTTKTKPNQTYKIRKSHCNIRHIKAVCLKTTQQKTLKSIQPKTYACVSVCLCACVFNHFFNSFISLFKFFCCCLYSFLFYASKCFVFFYVLLNTQCYVYFTHTNTRKKNNHEYYQNKKIPVIRFFCFSLFSCNQTSQLRLNHFFSLLFFFAFSTSINVVFRT